MTRSETDKIAAVTEGLQAFEQFCTPSLSSQRTADHDVLVKRARNHLKPAESLRIPTSIGEVQAYIFHPDTSPVANVLVVHGWTGEAAFMGAFGDFLRRRGFRAILIDMPAHGESEGHRVSLFDCAAAILEVAEALGPIQFALGHSIGAMALLTTGEGHYPLPRGYPFAAYALVSMPDKFADVTQKFGSDLGLSPEAQRIFEEQLEKLAGRTLADFTGSKLLASTGRPTQLLHSKDDTEVSFTCAQSMSAAVPEVELKSFDVLGHRAILYAPPVVRTAVTFFSEFLSTRQ